MKMEQSVPKRRHIKFRRREITQKKTYNIQNMAKVWNQVLICLKASFALYHVWKCHSTELAELAGSTL